MRIAGEILGLGPNNIDEAADYLASENWPSIHDPKPEPTKTDVKYDEHMKQYVPQIPVPVAGLPAVPLLHLLRKEVNTPATKGPI